MMQQRNEEQLERRQNQQEAETNTPPKAMLLSNLDLINDPQNPLPMLLVAQEMGLLNDLDISQPLLSRIINYIASGGSKQALNELYSSGILPSVFADLRAAVSIYLADYQERIERHIPNPSEQRQLDALQLLRKISGHEFDTTLPDNFHNWRQPDIDAFLASNTANAAIWQRDSLHKAGLWVFSDILFNNSDDMWLYIEHIGVSEWVGPPTAHAKLIHQRFVDELTVEQQATFSIVLGYVTRPLVGNISLTRDEPLPLVSLEGINTHELAPEVLVLAP
jgi:hypothetical protein